MGFLGLLILSLGAFEVTYGSKCIPETVECSQYWVKMEPHRDLMESEKELNSWCRKQALFHGCLQNVLLGSSGKMADLPTNLLISKMFADDLCSEGSHSRQRYLDNAACINQLNTEYCTLPEYLDIVTPDDAIPPSRCSLSEKTFSCIAATMVMNCGFDAGRVYRNLLKVTNYGEEVCDVESSEGIPPCQDPESDDSTREEKLSEVFYGLVHRFGVIPEQASGHDELPDFSRVIPEFNTDLDSLVSDVINSALDGIEDSSEDNEVPLSGESGSLEFQDTKHKSDTEFQPESYQTPYITEPFKGLLHYNYSGREFALYWRQPDSFPLQRVECRHMLPSFLNSVIFRCLLYRRMYEPPCLASEEGRDEMITPELIRDIDPDVPDDSKIEFGPRPYWMDELDGYKKERELREKSGTSRFSENSPLTLSTDSVTEIPTQPATCTTETRMRVFHNPDLKWWKCQDVFSPELREEIVSVLVPFLVPEVNESYMPLMSSYHTDDIGYSYIYETRMHEFENITCGRVNECHPRGRGVFKCSVFPRVMKICVNCSEELLVPSRVFKQIGDMLKPKSVYAVPRAGKEDTKITASSDSPHFETSSENLITLLLTDDETSVTEAEHDSDVYTEDIVAEEDNIVEIEEPQREKHQKSDIDSSTDVHIVFLEDDPKASNEELEFLSDFAYEADEARESRADRLRRLREAMGIPEDRVPSLREAYRLSTDNENNLINETIFVLQSVPSDSDSEATYEVVGSPEDEISQDAIDEILSTI